MICMCERAVHVPATSVSRMVFVSLAALVVVLVVLVVVVRD